MNMRRILDKVLEMIEVVVCAELDSKGGSKKLDSIKPVTDFP